MYWNVTANAVTHGVVSAFCGLGVLPRETTARLERWNERTNANENAERKSRRNGATTMKSDGGEAAAAVGRSSADPIVLSSDGDDESDCEVVKVVPAAAEKKQKIRRRLPSSIQYNHPPQSAFPQSNHFWSALNELVSSFEKKESNKSHPIHRLVCYSTSSYVCFYDKYRKARQHLLLIPRPSSPLGNINSISDLIPTQHLNDLREFHSRGRIIASALTENDQRHRMLMGYHAVPSLTPLHLHIISSDFDSECIKNKKHINSFTNSRFFVSPGMLEGHMVQRAGAVEGDDVKVSVDAELANSIINATPFSCFRCGFISKSVPQWKQHNLSCCMVLADDYGAQSKGNDSLLGFECICSDGESESKSKKHRAHGDAAKPPPAGKDIRGFFQSSGK